MPRLGMESLTIGAVTVCLWVLPNWALEVPYRSKKAYLWWLVIKECLDFGAVSSTEMAFAVVFLLATAKILIVADEWSEISPIFEQMPRCIEDFRLLSSICNVILYQVLLCVVLSWSAFDWRCADFYKDPSFLFSWCTREVPDLQESGHKIVSVSQMISFYITSDSFRAVVVKLKNDIQNAVLITLLRKVKECLMISNWTRPRVGFDCRCREEGDISFVSLRLGFIPAREQLPEVLNTIWGLIRRVVVQIHNNPLDFLWLAGCF